MPNRNTTPQVIRPPAAKSKKTVTAADVREEKEYIRGTFQFERQTGEHLDRLAAEFGGNRTDALRYALRIANKVLDAKAAGQQVIVLNPDNTIETQVSPPNEIFVPLLIGRRLEAVVSRENPLNEPNNGHGGDSNS
jgi:hypothetical protein